MSILEQLQNCPEVIWAKEEEPLEEYPQAKLINFCYRSDEDIWQFQKMRMECCQQ